MPVALLAGKVHEHGEACRAVHDGADRAALEPDQQIAFPMAGHGPVVGLGGTFADQRLRGDVGPRLATRPLTRHPQCPPRAQAPHQVAPECTTSLKKSDW